MMGEKTHIIVLNGWAARPEAWDACAFSRERIFSYIETLDGRAEEAVARAADGVILVGWSMGGSAALELAAKFPDRIRGLVLLAATARMMADENWKGMTPLRCKALKRALLEGEAPEPNPYFIDADANLERGLDYLRTVDVRAALLSRAAEGAFKFSVHIFQGEQDAVTRPSNVEFLQQIFPKAKVTRLEKCTHALPVEIPGAIDEAVMDVVKANIRCVMRAKRKALSDAERLSHSQKICRGLLARGDIQEAISKRQPIAVYLASRWEIDLGEFILAVLRQGGKIVAPRWTGTDYDLAEIAALDEECLVAGPMGILEPRANLPRVEPSEVGVWLVPGLAFTGDGRRLGYGGGWYDRLLAGISAGVPKLGIAYDFQVVDDLPHAAHDILLTEVVS